MIPAWLSKVGSEAKRIIKKFCDHPSHLQRWAIIGAGLAIFFVVGFFVWVVRWSFGDRPELYSQQLTIMGNALYGVLALWGLTIVALLGIVRGVKAMLPNGTSFEVDLTDKHDNRDRPNDPPY